MGESTSRRQEPPIKVYCLPHERELILRCLQKTGGNKRQAARLLQLSRTTFIDKMQRLNVAPGAA